MCQVLLRAEKVVEFQAQVLEFVTGGGVELLKAVLHGYAGGLIFMK